MLGGRPVRLIPDGQSLAPIPSMGKRKQTGIPSEIESRQVATMGHPSSGSLHHLFVSRFSFSFWVIVQE